jgi:hypothetical protein
MLRFVGCATKLTGRCDGMGHMSRSSSLLHMETSLVRGSQSGLKTSGDAMTSGTRGIIIEVASESS